MARTRLSICNKKVRYATEFEALLVVQRAVTLRPYRCDRCGQFHLTSRTKGKRIVRPVVEAGAAQVRSQDTIKRVRNNDRKP